MNNIQFFDSTLRDGSHAIAHQLTIENIRDFCSKADDAGLYVITVGHGNGLGASSLQVGLSKLTDAEMLATARKYLKHTRLGAFFIPGFGTIKDDIQPAIDQDVDVFSIGTHCTEADVTRQHIEYVRKKGKEVIGVLMMYHMIDADSLLKQAKLMESYGAQGILIMDSAGASTPEMVQERISLLTKNLKVKVGFHAHHNLGLAVSNSYEAVKAGAVFIDGTIRGFGAGAGNCQLEALAALLQKVGVKTNLDLYKLQDVSEKVVRKFMKTPLEINSIVITSGLAGVFSGFKPHVMKAAKRFNVDPRDIFMELGKRKMIAGQEDFIVDIAMYLAEQKRSKVENYSIESLL